MFGLSADRHTESCSRMLLAAITAALSYRRTLVLTFPLSSWPGLSRPSTSLAWQQKKDVDARHKAGHDESLARAVGIRRFVTPLNWCLRALHLAVDPLESFQPFCKRLACAASGIL